MQPRHPVPISPVCTLGNIDSPHLLADCCQRAISIQGQLSQGRATSALQLGNCRVNLGRNMIHSGPGTIQAARAWCTTRRSAAPFDDRAELTAQTTGLTTLALLLTPMNHQRFNFLNHRPRPPTIEPNTQILIPNTYPTHLQPFKINALIIFVLGVLGWLGLFVLA